MISIFAQSDSERLGFRVDIHECFARGLGSRGGGIVLQPDVIRVFRPTCSALLQPTPLRD